MKLSSSLFYLLPLLGLFACAAPDQQKIPAAEPLKTNPANAYTIHLDTSADRQTHTIVFQTANGYDTLSTRIPLYLRCTLQTMQLDSVGLKEVMLTWTQLRPGRWYIGNFTNASSDTLYTFNEIWSLEKKERIIKAGSHYRASHSTWHEASGGKRYGERTDSLSYRYDFTVTENGKMSIARTQVYKNAAPDHLEGIYAYKNGTMVREKDRKGQPVFFQTITYKQFMTELNAYEKEVTAKDTMGPCDQYVLRFTVHRLSVSIPQQADTTALLCSLSSLHKPKAIGSRYCIVKTEQPVGHTDIMTFYYQRKP